MVFQNYGGIWSLRIEDANDLAEVLALGPAQWAATSLHAGSLQCDPAFLGYLNPAECPQVRVEHFKAAITWSLHILSNKNALGEPSDRLELADLDTSHAEGRRLQQAAEHILEQLGSATQDSLSVEQVRDFRRTYAKTPPNGDGVLPLEHISDPRAAELAADVLGHVGAVRDLSGKDGINTELLDEFLERSRRLLDWSQRAEEDDVLVWGSETKEAAALIASLDDKIEEFFSQCDLLRVDPRAAGAFRLSETDLRELENAGTAVVREKLQEAPLQAPHTGGTLSLALPVNPHYQGRWDQLAEHVFSRLEADLRGELNRASWRRIQSVFDPYRKWQTERPLPDDSPLSEGLAKKWPGSPAEQTLRRLLSEDAAVSDELDQINRLEKIILYRRWLLELANNFVSLAAVYDPDRRALFEMGDLVVDGRVFAFTVKVVDRAQHKKIATASRMFLMYVEITDDARDGERFEIAVAVTAGVKGGIELGKRGVFYDLDGKEWNARVVDIIENPISLREAIQAPFIKVKRFLAEKAEAFVGTRARSLEDAATQITGDIEKGEVTEKTQKPVSAPTGGLRDVLLGGGIAFAAIGSTLAYLMNTMAEINLINAGTTLLVIISVVVLFTTLSGWSRLRHRDMSALLEAAGWSVNFRMYMTHQLGQLFTRTPGLPKGAKKDRHDLVRRFLGRSRFRTLSWTGLVILAVALGAVAFFALGVDLEDAWSAILLWLNR